MDMFVYTIAGMLYMMLGAFAMKLYQDRHIWRNGFTTDRANELAELERKVDDYVHTIPYK